MKRFLILALLLTGGACSAATFDSYGGWQQSPCAGLATGHWYTEKVASQWWICTPQGNHYFLEGVGAWVYPGSSAWGGSGTVLASKYGNSTNTAALNVQKEILGWNFNAVGELSFGLMEPITPCTGCKLIPEIQTINTGGSALFNRFGYSSGSPMKSLEYGMNSAYYGVSQVWHIFGDFYDPAFNTYVAAYFANDASFQAYANNSYVMGLSFDDTDWFWGVGCGPDFDCFNFGGGHNNGHVGWMTMITSPMQTFNIQAADGNFGAGDTELYTDTKVYSKTAMGSPPASCTLTTPCSLRDYLAKKYVTIGALNTAWSTSGFYTSFDSTGTSRTQTICTGTTWTGSNSTCSDTLTNLNVSPESVQVKVDSVLQAGDCPWFVRGSNQQCGVLSANTGFLGGLTANTIASTSTINYTTGAVTINFKSAPSAGAHTITVTYMQNGWGYGTGLMDEDGRNTSWMGHSPICVVAVANTGPGSASWACRPGNPGSNPAVDANPTMATDLDDWMSEYSYQYFHVYRTNMTTYAPHTLYLGADVVSTWMNPANKQIIKAEGPNVDIMFTQLGYTNDISNGGASYNSLAVANAGLSYQTQALGDVPMLNFINTSANADSGEAANASPDAPPYYATQAARGAGWYTLLNWMLTNKGFSGTYPWVGIVWWGSHDFPSESMNFGLCSLTDNCYNGHDPASGSVSCSAPVSNLTCGSEPVPGGSAVRPFGNGLTSVGGISDANALWYSGPSTLPPTAPKSALFATLPIDGEIISTRELAEAKSLEDTTAPRVPVDNVFLGRGIAEPLGKPIHQAAEEGAIHEVDGSLRRERPFQRVCTYHVGPDASGLYVASADGSERFGILNSDNAAKTKSGSEDEGSPFSAAYINKKPLSKGNRQFCDYAIELPNRRGAVFVPFATDSKFVPRDRAIGIDPMLGVKARFKNATVGKSRSMAERTQYSTVP